MTTKLFSSVLCVLILFVSVGAAIRCNYCSASTSWASCYAKLRRVQCESHITSCITYFLQTKNNPNDVAYGVGCAKTCNKNAVPDCRPGGRLNCEVNCCSYDYCNNIPSSRPTPIPSQGIKCYYCTSTTSWAACYASVRRVQCTSEVRSCLMATSKNKYNPNDVAFITGCAKTCDKNYISDCRPGGNLNCEFKCCSSDFCNHRSADLPTVKTPASPSTQSTAATKTPGSPSTQSTAATKTPGSSSTQSTAATNTPASPSTQSTAATTFNFQAAKGKATAQLTDMKLILVSTVGTLVIALTKMV